VSQVATKRKLQLRDAKVRAVAHFREEGSVLAGTKTGVSEGLTIELSIDSDEAHERIVALIRQAHQMCFTEQALSSTPPIRSVHRLNGQQIDVGPAGSVEPLPDA
jgi:organic hydroperoxide reductase OsmC/OhrA